MVTRPSHPGVPLWLVALLLWSGLIAVIRALSRDGAAPELCPLRRLTGVACPTCGGTRAIEQVASGDLAGALWMNPLVTALVPAALFATLAAALLPAVRARTTALLRARWPWWTLLALLGANWLFLLVSGGR